MKDFAIIFGVLVLWIVLNAWILPWFGISTCMSGGCSTDRCSSCGPGPWSEQDQDASNTKGEQP